MRHHCAFLLIAALLPAFAFAQTPAKPPVIADADALAARAKAELRVTRPDFVVFKPEIKDGEVSDTGNEHFLVFDGPDGSLMAVWTQSSAEAQPDQHITFSKSTDEGVTWSKPRIIAGPKKAGDGHMASWGYPLVSKSGRIYVLYSQHIGKHDSFFHHTGWLHGVHSDDNGATWSQPQNVPVARSVNDNPDPSFPPNMLCWQKPLRLGEDGKYFAGFTRWTSNAVRKNPTKAWISHDARVEFMRFENVDDSPEVKDLKISWFAANDKALTVPFPGHPEVSACQEPSMVKLPDGRLFVVMRTASGSPFWSVSADQGETWTTPRRLLRKDGGDPLPHPLSPCPIYDVGGNTAGSGRYALFIHNNDGHHKGYGPADTGFNRRPVYLAAGRFQAGADQPVWFDEPRLFMDHDGVGLGKPGTPGRQDLALYASFTVRNGKAVLWYPDRKFFLLGRIIGDEWFEAKPGENQGDTSLAPPPVDTTPGPRFGDAARAFQGIPGIERAANGRLWAVWYAGGSDEPGEGPGNYVVLVSSGDDGKTWSAPRLVIDPPGPVRAYDPCLWHDPRGRLWLFWAQSYNWWDGRSGVWAIVAENSGDEAPRWSAPRRLCDGIMMNKPTVLSNGEWLLPAAVWNRPADPRTPVEHRRDLADARGANVVASKDRGATWNVLGRARVPGRTFDEHMIVERGTGGLWMLVRTSYGIGESESSDGGATWSPGRPSSIPHVDARFFLRRLNSGKLLLVTHEPPDHKSRSHLTARLSEDDGATWTGGLVIDERPGVSYPDGVQAPDGVVYLIYDHDRTGEKQILMATFTESDVAQGRWASDRARSRVVVNQASGAAE